MRWYRLILADYIWIPRGAIVLENIDLARAAIPIRVYRSLITAVRLSCLITIGFILKFELRDVFLTKLIYCLRWRVSTCYSLLAVFAYNVCLRDSYLSIGIEALVSPPEVSSHLLERLVDL